MKRVALVVDDSMLIRHAVCSYFEDRGFAVESATNGQEAMEIMARVRPDIILTDIHMPKVDGSQFIQVLKSNPQTAKIPIVVLTARNFSPGILVDMPADYVVFKDFDIGSQLQSVLESALPGYSAER
jgi:CheY-like chemotaxis protein